MNTTALLSEARKAIPVEVGRLTKIAVGLRKAGQFPDGRKKGEEVTPTHAAYLLRAMALNLNPFADDFEDNAKDFIRLYDDTGTNLIDYLSTLLADAGEQLYIQGVHRVSFSLDRPTVVVVFRDPDVQYKLDEHGSTYFQVKETERVFGEKGPLPFERFSIIKHNFLKTLALKLQPMGHNIIA